MLSAILTAVLLCPAPPAPDLSTPEKAAQAFAAMYLPRFYEDSKLAKLIDGGDLLGREHYTRGGWEQIERVVADAERTRERSKTLRWSFKLGTVNRSGTQAVAQVWVTQRRNRYDYGKKRVRVVEQRVEHRFVFQRVGSRWLVSSASKGCYACSASGVCGLCRGTGKLIDDRPCSECKRGVCATCGGKKLLSEELSSSFKAGVLGKRPGAYAVGDLSSPRKAVKAFLRLRARKQEVLGAARAEHFAKTLALWRPYFVPALVKTFERNMAKSQSEIAARQEEWNRIARLGEIENRGGGRAYGLVHYVIPPSPTRKGTTLKFRLDLRQEGARWLIEQVQTKCYSCKRTRICKYCSGSGKDRRGVRACVSCRGTAACNPCQGLGWIESSLIP